MPLDPGAAFLKHSGEDEGGRLEPLKIGNRSLTPFPTFRVIREFQPGQQADTRRDPWVVILHLLKIRSRRGESFTGQHPLDPANRCSRCQVDAMTLSEVGTNVDPRLERRFLKGPALVRRTSYGRPVAPAFPINSVGFEVIAPPRPCSVSRGCGSLDMK